MQRIKQNTSTIRTTPGTTLSNTKGEVIYTPPSGEEVIREKLRNLEVFINEDASLDPLINWLCCIINLRQYILFLMEMEEPGRILLLLYLKIEKLLDIPVIYLSEYIIQNKIRIL